VTINKIEIFWIATITLGIELLTCFLRFYAGLESTRDTYFLSPLTFGLRIHHGYIGILLIIISLFIHNSIGKPWIMRVGIALALSDIIHHFIVLKLITGNSHFDFFYPKGDR
jgi:hypothetical protein